MDNNKALGNVNELEKALIDFYVKSPAMPDKELYNYVLDQVVALTDSKIGFFHLVSDDQKIINLNTWNKEALKNCTAPQEGHYPIEQAGNWVDCVKQKKPVIYNDFPQSPNQKGLPKGHVPIVRFLSVPVVDDGKVKVIFGVGNKEDDYTQNDADKVQIVANTLENIIKQRKNQTILEEKLAEAEKLNQLMVNRELKMVKLKEEIEKLKEKLKEK